MNFEGDFDCLIRIGVELAFAFSILLRLIVECINWNWTVPLLRIESSSSHWTDFETPKTFVRPPRKPPDKRILSEQTISRIQSILLFRPAQLIVGWISPFGRPHCFRKPNSRAEILSTPLNESLESGESLETPRQVMKTRTSLRPQVELNSRHEC
jgi:hypothetical protein